MILHVKNWSEFQHYTNRKPPWIKLHRELLDDYDWHRLPDASKALAPMLWLLASESKEGAIDAEPDQLAFRLHTTPQKFDAALKPLIAAGFITVASGALADCKQDACSESERETEQERDTEADTESACALFNDAAKRTGWPAVQKFDADRKKLMKARLRDVGGIEGFAIAVGKAEASQFLTVGWPNFNLDWMLKPKNFRKLMEGNYDNRDREDPNERSLSAGLAGIYEAGAR